MEAADVVVFCRNIEPAHSWILRLAKSRGTPVIYDLDDNFFVIPEGVPGSAYIRDAERQKQLREYVASADLVRVYSEGTAESAQEVGSRVEIVEPPADPSLVRRVVRRRSDEVTIVYATSRDEDYLAEQFMSGATQVLDQRPNVSLHFWGYAPSALVGHPQVRYHRYEPSYERFVRRFARAGFDIGLAPLVDDAFHSSKTNNKYREYGMAGVAGIYSDVSVYRSSIEGGRTGLLVENTGGAWRGAIDELVGDAILRGRIAESARADVAARYSYEEFCDTWRDQLSTALGSGVRPGSASQGLGCVGLRRRAVGSRLAASGYTHLVSARVKNRLGRLVRRGPR